MKKRSEVKKKSAADRTAPMFDGVEVTKCEACGEKVRIDDVKSKNTAGEPECPDCGAPLKFKGEVETKPSTDETKKPPNETKPVSNETKPVSNETKEAEREKAIADAKVSTAISGKFCPTCGDQWPIIKGSLTSNCGHGGEPIDDPKKATKFNPAAGHQRREERVTLSKEELDRISMKNAFVTEKTQTHVREIDVPWPVSTFAVDRNADLRVGGFRASVVIGEGQDMLDAAPQVLKQLRQLADMAFAEQLAWYVESTEKLRKKLDEE